MWFQQIAEGARECLTVLTRASSGLKRLGGRRLRGSLDGRNREDTEGIATVLHANCALRMLTKAPRELAFGRRGHCKSPSTAAFSTSCSLIVPSNNVLRDETEFNTTGVGRGRRVSRVRISPIHIGRFEYRTTRNDTPRHDAVGY